VRPSIGRPVKRIARRLGFDIVRAPAEAPAPDVPVDIDADAIALFRRVQPYTLTGIERVVALRDAIRHVVAAGVDGAVVECGVWKGGSMVVVAETLLSLGVRDRDLYLFDTFTKMPPPDDVDVDAWGVAAASVYDDVVDHPFYAFDQAEVRRLLVGTGYPEERLHFVQGMVEDTIPEHAPERIALCRLDTDWYASVSHELRHLVPRVSEGGIVLIDDYGHFAGSRKAVDEYLAEQGVAVLLHRIDYSGRLFVVSPELRARARG
jgi:O-methyltransferase